MPYLNRRDVYTRARIAEYDSIPAGHVGETIFGVFLRTLVSPVFQCHHHLLYRDYRYRYSILSIAPKEHVSLITTKNFEYFIVRNTPH